MTGISGSGDHIIKGDHSAVWAGTVDDLWKLGKPRGEGGPWKDKKIEANTYSDPYLMTGYDKKSVSLKADQDTEITMEIDIDGTGLWVNYKTFKIEAGKELNHQFPKAFSAYWVRVKSSKAAKATAWFVYE